MLPLRSPNTTRVLAENQDEYLSLPIQDVTIPAMLSLWEITPAELALLNAGGRISLVVLGTSAPPVLFSVQAPPE